MRSLGIVAVCALAGGLSSPETAGDQSAGDLQHAGVDIVHLRLLRMEARRWQKEALASISEEDTFEDWAFGGAEGVRRFRQQLDRLLDRRIQEVRQVHQLSPAQDRKLRLAGKGDIQRLLDLVADARGEFDRARADAKRLAELQNRLRLIELRVAENPFGVESLFAKVLSTMLQSNQIRKKRAGNRS